MVDILLRNVPAAINKKLREEAARNKRTLSDEALASLMHSLFEQPVKNGYSIVESLRAGLEEGDFVDLDISRDNADRPPVDFS